MANPIKSSDLIIDDGAIKAMTEQLKELRGEIDAINKKTVQYEKQTQKANVVNKQGQEQIEKMAKEAVKLQRAKDKLAEAESELGKRLALVREETKKANRQTRLQIKLNESAEGSYNQLSAQYSLIKERLNAMSKAQRETTEEGQKLVKQSKAIYQEMKRLQEETGKTALNVGNYKESIKEALTELNQVPGATGQAVGGLQQLGNTFKVLSRNPLIAVIGLLVGAVSTLFSAFTRTEKGAQLLDRVSGILSGVWSGLVGIASDLAEQAYAAFNDPQQAVKDLWEAIKENVVDRFQGLIELFEAVGKGLKGIWQLDLQQIRNAASDAGTAITQMLTGLTGDEQKQLREDIQDLTNDLIENARSFEQLAIARRNTARANRELIKEIERLRTEEETLRTVSDDTTKSFKEREEAAAAARQALEQRASREIELARNNLSLINREIDLRRANGENIETLLDSQLAAYQEFISAEREYTIAVRDNERERSELKQDRLERDLDILIDGFDNQKTVNERLIADDKRTLEERQDILEETQRLADNSFRKQIETIQQFTGVQVDANDLIAESDAVVLNQKIRSLGLSEIIEGRLLEIVRDRRLAVQDLAEAEQDLNKERQKNLEAEQKQRQRERDEAYQNALEILQQEEDLQKSRFEITKRTATEKAVFELELEREKLEKILALNQAFGDQLNLTQQETIRNQIAAIDSELDLLRNGGKEFSIYKLLGFDLDDNTQRGIETSLGIAKQSFAQLSQARIDAANVAVSAAERQSQAAEKALDQEIEARNQGFANNVETAKEELRLARENQEAALREQEKAQKREQLINSVQQASNLITASSKIWAQLGFPFAIPAIGGMWASFIAAKVRAFSITKDPRGEGSYEFLDYGGSHASGNDIPLGMTKEGKQRTVERGEGLAVFNKRNTSKYGSLLPEVVDAINRGVFETKFERISQGAKGASIVNMSTNVNTSKMERSLSAIEKQGRNKTYTDSKGRRVVIEGNVKRIYA